MAWQQTPYTIPLIAATGSSLVLALVAWRHRDYTGARSLTALMGGAAWWSATYAVGIANSTTAVKILSYKLMYLGVGIVPVAWLVFAIEYTGRLEALTRRQVALLFAVPAITAGLALTNQFHGLIWADVDTVTRSGIVVTEFGQGAWFWVWSAYSYLLLAVGAGLLVQMMVLSEHVYRGQAVALTVAVVIPWGANALYLSGLTGVWDPTNVGFVFSGAIMTASVFRQRLLEVVPVAREVARDEIIDSMTEAVIVVDEHDNVVDLNPAAVAIVGQSARDVIGNSVDVVLPAVADVRDSAADASPARGEVTIPEDGTDRTYAVRLTPLRRGYGTITGQLITLRDVSERKDRERRIERQRQRLEVVNRVLRHDIRNDMNVVLGHADALLTDARPDESHVMQIKQKGKAIVDLSEKARRLERIVGSNSVEREVVDIVEVVEREIADLEATYPDAEFLVDGPVGAEVYGIEFVDSAIGNVLENAVEHNDQPTPRVEVSVEAGRARVGDDSVTVAVADNGPGLPEREREVIETGTETALEHSRGLGLWLAYWVVTRSGGTIELSENEPRGTIITIRLQSAGSGGQPV